MDYFLDFLRQECPRDSGAVPPYFRHALASGEIILSIYFALAFLLFPLLLNRWEWFPGVLFAATVLNIFKSGRSSAGWSVTFHAIIILSWCGWHTYFLGWNSGAQLLLLPVLMLCFFNIFMAPWKKILSFFFIVLYWLALYCYALHFPPVCVPERLTNILLQTSNSLALFLMMVSGFVVFSSSIQKTERQLMIANQELSAAASTDPLTQLPNRRAMLERIENYLKESESRRFSVAIADIDFFKKVNDTYGHDCGDYTLRSLSDLFRREAGEDYWVCRWGGEEFCIFLPGKNLDVAGEILFRLVNTVRNMKLSYNSVSFSITITAGVAENDFVSPLSAILKEADDKLYQGKMNGRDQVVI